MDCLAIVQAVMHLGQVAQILIAVQAIGHTVHVGAVVERDALLCAVGQDMHGMTKFKQAVYQVGARAV